MKKTINLKLYLLSLLSLLILLVGTNTKALALNSNIPEAPTQDIFVQDYANIIDTNSKDKLLQMSEDLRNSGKAELAIVTIPSLNGDDLDEYANTLFRTWGIGNKDSNNGLLVLLVKDSHQIRIEVGKGLEGNITDAKAGDVIKLMSPFFKNGKFGEGLIAGHQALTKMIIPGAVVEQSNTTISNSTNENTDNGIVISVFLFVISVISVYLIKVFIFDKKKETELELKDLKTYKKIITETPYTNQLKHKSENMLNTTGSQINNANSSNEDKRNNKSTATLDTDKYLQNLHRTRNTTVNSTKKATQTTTNKVKPQTSSKPVNKQSTSNGYNKSNNNDYYTPSYDPSPSYVSKREDDYSSTWDFGSSSDSFGGGTSDGGGADGGW